MALPMAHRWPHRLQTARNEPAQNRSKPSESLWEFVKISEKI
jgi:hypothetical protein